MKIPVPKDIAQTISQRAVQYCRQDIQARGWRSSGAIQPVYAHGRVGLRTTVKYLMHQDKGINPFVMWWVKDRTLPLACAQGDGPHFRTGRDVGKPGYVNIPHVGRVWRDQKWRHPGLKPKRFMESSINKAIRDSQADLKDLLRQTLSGGNAA